MDNLQALPIKAAIKHYIVAQEPHKDGSPHLHVYVNYDKKVSFEVRRWDIAGFHGNYQPVDHWRGWAKYCQKGANFITNFDLEAAASKKASGRAQNELIMSTDLKELIKTGDIHVRDYLRLQANKAAIIKDSAPLLPRCEHYIPNSLGKILPLLTEKRRHYWFWSASPNKGKTTFLNEIFKSFPSYRFVYKENFQSIHPQTQFIILDEYTSPHLPLTQLNQMCDNTWQYSFKGGSAVTVDNVTILICGNKPPEEVYPNLHELIKARFNVFEL